MKELSIEQKAKRYDEAIERAKEINNEQHAQPFNIMTRVFPELAESEDEKIRKYIIKVVHEWWVRCNDPTPDFPNEEQMLTWLEKCSEHKSADSIPQDFEKYVEHFLSLSDGEGHGSPAKVKEVSTELLRLANRQKSAWSEEDEKTLNAIALFLSSIDYLEDPETWINWLKSLKDRVMPQLKQEWSVDDEDMHYKVIAVINRLCAEGKDYVWSIKTLKKLFYWLKFLKDRVQPKQEWSEEDEKMLKDIDACIVKLPVFFSQIEINGEDKTCKEFITSARNWLKSLRPRNDWKPSEEQMVVLNDIIINGHLSNANERILKGLQEQLKKLREE